MVLYSGSFVHIVDTLGPTKSVKLYKTLAAKAIDTNYIMSIKPSAVPSSLLLYM